LPQEHQIQVVGRINLFLSHFFIVFIYRLTCSCTEYI